MGHGCRVVVGNMIREKRGEFHLSCALSFLRRHGDYCAQNFSVQWDVSGSNPRNSKHFALLNATPDCCSPTVYVVVVVVALVLCLCLSLLLLFLVQLLHTSLSCSISTLLLVQPLHTSLSCSISTLLALFAQPRILASSVFLGWAGGPWGRDPFNISDLCSGTHFLFLSGIRLQSLLLSQN